jgi:hypothetical protein
MRTAQSSLIASPAMDAARALADLVEISPQIGAAVVSGGDGETLGSIGVAEERAGGLADAGRALLEGAAGLGGEGTRVTQIHASLAAGDVFAVVGAGGTIVAVTSRPQAPGLVFYDLKRCLAALAEPEPAQEREQGASPRRRRLFRRDRGG